MKRHAGLFGLWVVLLLPAMLALGCSDDDKPKDQGVDSIDGTTPDMGVDTIPDTGAPDMPVATSMGEGCQSQKDCKAGSPVCLTLDKTKAIGICSMECTPDDPSTQLINEDNCPSGFLCASFPYTTVTYNYCLKKCSPDITKNTCPASSKQACYPASTRYGDTDQPVCWYLACVDGKDCPVLSEQTCVADSECTSVGTDAFCDPSSKRCARPGNCTVSGICGVHTMGKATAKVGDPCNSDFDCPNNGRCFEESTDSNSIGAAWRNGYCTISNCTFATGMPDFACPTGSTCHSLYYGGICAKTCKLAGATDCRNNALDKGGDYECYAWNNLYIGGVQIAAEPICLSAAGQTCDSLGTSLDCSSLGDQGNPTNMKCRDRHTGVPKTLKDDPGGVCLDDTASGPFEAAPDGGMPDSVMPDSAMPDSAAPDSIVAPDAGTPDQTVTPDAAQTDL